MFEITDSKIKQYLKGKNKPNILYYVLLILRLSPIFKLITFANLMYFEDSNRGTLFWIREQFGINGQMIALISLTTAIVYALFFIKPDWWLGNDPLKISLAALIRVFCLSPLFMFGIVSVIRYTFIDTTAPNTSIWLWGMFFLLENSVLLVWLGLSQIAMELNIIKPNINLVDNVDKVD